MLLLKLTPIPIAGKQILSNQEVYWYPLRINDDIFTSINMCSKENYHKLQSTWIKDGRNIVSVNFDKFIIFLYFGTIGDKKVIPLFNKQPLLVKDDSIYYFITKDEFINEVFYKINNFIDDINLRTESKEKIDLYYSFKKSKNIYEKCELFFKYYFKPNWEVKLKQINSDDCPYCTDENGLNPLLNLISILPNNPSVEENDKAFLSFLIKNGFLSSWFDINNIKNQKIKNNIKTESFKLFNKDFLDSDINKVIKNIIYKLNNNYEIFRILYLIANSAGEKSIFKLFVYFYQFLPKYDKIYAEYPKFQPKIVINGLEIHFIQSAKNEGHIINFRNELTSEIFDDEITYYLAGIDEIIKKNFRYRFIGRLGIEQDYIYLPRTIENVAKAIQNIAEKYQLNQDGNEMWVKKIRIKIITPPQFEHDVLDAFSKINPLIIHLSPDKSSIELLKEKKLAIINAEIICDYKIYKDNKYLFAKEFNYDFQRGYSILNKILKYKGITIFGL